MTPHRRDGVALASSSGMRITISGVDVPVADRTRAYAEYRFFANLARHAAVVHAVSVVLQRKSLENPLVHCTVTIDLGAGGRVKTQARGGHPTAAIDRAADRAAWLLHRRTERSFHGQHPSHSLPDRPV